MTQGENPTNAMQDHMWDFLKDDCADALRELALKLEREK